MLFSAQKGEEGRRRGESLQHNRLVRTTQVQLKSVRNRHTAFVTRQSLKLDNEPLNAAAAAAGDAPPTFPSTSFRIAKFNCFDFSKKIRFFLLEF